MRRSLYLLALLTILLLPAAAYALDEPTLDGFVQAFAAVKAAKDADPQLLNASLAVLFGLGLKWVIGIYHAWRPVTNRSRDFLPYVCLGVGGMFCLFAHLECGMSWGGAVTVGLAGPLGVAWHEYVSKHKDIMAPQPVTETSAPPA